MHGGAEATRHHVERLAIDARLEEAVHALQEVVHVELRVEAHDVAAEQSIEELVAPRADGKCLGIGPRDVPERDDRGLGQALADHARQEREVIVLHEHHRVLARWLPAPPLRRTCD
jgi:hypothetical protein